MTPLQGTPENQTKSWLKITNLLSVYVKIHIFNHVRKKKKNLDENLDEFNLELIRSISVYYTV